MLPSQSRQNHVGNIAHGFHRLGLEDLVARPHVCLFDFKWMCCDVMWDIRSVDGLSSFALQVYQESKQVRSVKYVT